ncbi:MAG: hypothetical protein HQ518_06570 [Rhodopirellula sp.]|nr:hypothetical protein [Rhodopirellula sp.]
MSAWRIPRIAKFLYNHNPFYLISACLFVYGLQAVFRPGEVDLLFDRFEVAYIDPWFLMFGLCSVTLLMGVTAYLIVRFGKVWDDARSLVLVLLLMFLAISVSFDEIVTLASWDDNSVRDAVCLLGFGLCFAVTLTESLLRGLRIRLPWSYRAPLYAFLGLFFTFPLWVSPEVADVTMGQARWRVAAFPMIAGLITLALLPAVRAGKSALSNNGTPWNWPWIPWTVFVFIAGAVCFRSYSLAISFDLGKAKADFWDTSFGMYFLIPFLIPVLFVLLEIGLVERIKQLQQGTILAAPLLLLIAYPWFGPWTRYYTYTRFASEFVETAGSPVFLALMGLLTFYGYAWVRGLRRAETGFVAMLLLAVFVDPNSFGYRTFAPSVQDAQAWPLITLGILEIGLSIARRNSRQALVGALSLSLAVGLLVADTKLAGFKASVTFHLVLASTLIISTVFRDDFARRLQFVAAGAIGAASGIAILDGQRFGLPVESVGGYVGGMTVLAFAYGLQLRAWPFMAVGILNCAGGLASIGLWIVRFIRDLTIPDGVKPLLWAMGCFSLAVLISTLKGGLAERLEAHWSRFTKDETGPDI